MGFNVRFRRHSPSVFQAYVLAFQLNEVAFFVIDAAMVFSLFGNHDISFFEPGLRLILHRNDLSFAEGINVDILGKREVMNRSRRLFNNEIVPVMQLVFESFFYQSPLDLLVGIIDTVSLRVASD